MKFNQTKTTTQQPSSALGIMRFFDSDSKTPKISPEIVAGITIAFVVLVILIGKTGL